MRGFFVFVSAGAVLAASVVAAEAGWGGCRVGVQGGFVNGAAALTSNPGSLAPLLKPDGTSPMGGVEAGCDVGLPFVVVGLGASYDFMNAVQRRTNTEVTGIAPAQVSRTVAVDSRSRGIATLSARAGFDLGPFLLFGRVGYAMAPQTSRYSLTVAAPLVGSTTSDLSVSHWRAGYVLGLGAEMQLGPAVLKLEYDYYDFGTRNALMKGLYNSPSTGFLPLSMKLGNTFTVNTLRAGVAYKF